MPPDTLEGESVAKVIKKYEFCAITAKNSWCFI